jgi:hypothetical protein
VNVNTMTFIVLGFMMDVMRPISSLKKIEIERYWYVDTELMISLNEITS